MAFKKTDKKTVSPGWVCGCGKTQPHYILYCPRCQKGKSK